MLYFECPKCKQKLAIENKLIGTQAQCSCSAQFIVPANGDTATLILAQTTVFPTQNSTLENVEQANVTMLTALKNTFNGRASRKEFCFFISFVAISNIFAYPLKDIFKSHEIFIYLNLILFLPILSVWVRRLHDIGKSGFHLSVPILSTIIYTLFIYKSDYDEKKNVSFGVGILLAILYILVLAMLNSTPSVNKYGFPSKEVEKIQI